MRSEDPQPGSDERDELARLLPAPPEREIPSGRQRQLQEFVVNHIQDQGTTAPPRSPKRRFAYATGALAAVAAAAVVLGVATGGGNVPPPGQKTAAEIEAARVIELAASYAEAQPWEPPGPDQWMYIKDHSVSASAMSEYKGMRPESVDETWISYDGSRFGELVDGEGEPEVGGYLNDDSYPYMLSLPVEPNALIDALEKELVGDGAVPRDEASSGTTDDGVGLPGNQEEWNAWLFARISAILRDNLLPPNLTAALWRAAGMIPGVAVEGTVMVEGRETLAVGRVTEAWQHEQLLVDPETYEFVGYRSVAIADFSYPPFGDDPAVTETAGTTLWELTRLDAGFVDNVGDRP
ncbi:CU044_5270 family protein [Phytomonospora endophytica]|uniref:CU044_5270 family protein n=1 Tax=Phytomonospora endophytica TaxID=714109 RepID=A0A841FPK3_9ACTN|nr:CU044_5270 family protein [Phytomonospora endophytica]MBB6036773.1 hypothetical protein [Phytomonospora endophytica]GIG68193.1 hypothetical protein Pen01_44880 [Phytomonospora endophytica]